MPRKILTTVLLSLSILGTSFSPNVIAADNEWIFEGDFSKMNTNLYSPVLRYFEASPPSPKSIIKNVGVQGYKDGNIVVGIVFDYAVSIPATIEEELQRQKLGTCDKVTRICQSIDPNRLADFLDVFVQDSLIPKNVKEAILNKIETETISENQIQPKRYINIE